MPLVILIIGIVLIAAAINNKLPQLMGLLKEDFAPTDGSPSFQMWFLAIVLIGSIGYVRQFKGFSNTFLALVLLSILLANENQSGGGGFFAKLTQAFKE